MAIYFQIQMLTCLGHTTTQSHPMDISDSCRQMLPLFQAALPATVTLDIQLPSPGPVIRANRHQIQQQVLTPWQPMPPKG
ncbi:MAG: hypothetical protein AB7S77_12670 [Desulfatirhabdiaceae bacterium]